MKDVSVRQLMQTKCVKVCSILLANNERNMPRFSNAQEIIQWEIRTLSCKEMHLDLEPGAKHVHSRVFPAPKQRMQTFKMNYFLKYTMGCCYPLGH